MRKEDMNEKHNFADTRRIFQRDCAVLPVYSRGCTEPDSLEHYPG